MKNLLLITLTQNIPAQLRSISVCWRSSAKNGGVSHPAFLPGIRDYLPEGKEPRKALVALRPDIWLTARSQYPDIRLYNHYGFVFSLVKALNETGFVVDLIDSHSKSESALSPYYDLFVGHGGFCQWILDQLPAEIPVFQYISGLYWKAFDAESDARYERFFSSRRLSRPVNHRRSLSSQIVGLESLNMRANHLFSIQCPRMVAAYGPYSHKFHFTGLGAFLDELFSISEKEKDFDAGRRNFIYVGGTGGNLQKGLDLLLEAFSEMPDLEFYIYCKVEEEIHRHCRKELACPNIHYIYHWRYAPFHNRLRELLKRTNFSVHAPINIGMGTAFMASMGSGLIPVGYVDVPDPGESAVLTGSWQVEDLVECVRRASEKPAEWCREAARLTKLKYAEHCDPTQVERNFRQMFENVPKPATADS